MFKWNTNNIIDATGGRGINGCNWTHSSNISTDTRSIKKGDLFIALKVKNFDGHNFLHEAFLKGAAAAIVNEGKYKNFILEIFLLMLKLLQLQAVSEKPLQRICCTLFYRNMECPMQTKVT